MSGGARRFLRRLANALFPGRAEAELAREVAAHQALIEEEYRRRGASDEDARLAARRALDDARAKDRHRDARSFVWLDDLRRDAAHALRDLRRSPAFAGVAILTLGVAIGAGTAILAFVDHVLVRSLPMPDAGRLVRLYESNPAEDRAREMASPPNIADWRRAAKTLDLVTAIGGTSVTMTGAAQAESLIGMIVGPEYFPITGVRLALGHPFDPGEYESAANAALGSIATREPITGPASIIISHAVWRRQFGGAPDVVGRTVALNGNAAVVRGVMPANVFLDQSPWGAADCWIPLVESRVTQRRFRQFLAVARLSPGASIAGAQHEMSAIAADLAGKYPAADKGWTVAVANLRDSMTGESRRTLLILFGGVACVLLVAVVNFAHLLLMRAAVRAREMAIRIAIGAGRWRLIRQWVTESAVLAVLGGLAGFVLALWMVPVLVDLAPADLARLKEVSVDARIFLLAVIASAVVGTAAAIPSLSNLRDMNSLLLRSSGAAARGLRRFVRPTLVALQVGLAVLLLVATGLIGRTLLTVRHLDLGFDPSHVLTFGTDEARLARYRDLTASLQFRQELTTALLASPVVEAAGVGAVPLFNRVTESFRVEATATSIDGNVNVPSPGYFPALRIRLVSGRLLRESDNHDAEKVVVVNQTFARRAWGGAGAAGQRIRYDQESSPWMTVVGVVADQRMSRLEDEPPAMVFVPYRQSTMVSIPNFVVRTTGDPDAVIPLVREAVRRIDPAIAVSRVATMEERYRKVLAPRAFNLWLVGAFSLIALVLSAVGVYGLVNETVTSRTPEIGVRMALGSSSFQAVLLVLKGGVVATSIGVLAGLAVAAAVTRSIQSILFGVTPLDLVSMTAAPLSFVVVAAIAAIAPARRASRVDPLIALRSD